MLGSDISFSTILKGMTAEVLEASQKILIMTYLNVGVCFIFIYFFLWCKPSRSVVVY